MADKVICTDKVDFKTILDSLWGRASGINKFRIKVTTTGERGAVIDCNNKAEFEDLFRQAIVVADDGYMALRVIITDFSNGSGLDLYPSCGIVMNWQEIARGAFTYDVNGDVAFNLASIT